LIDATPILGIVEIVLLVILCVVGFHIFVAVGILGAAFSILYLGWGTGIQQIGQFTWAYSWHYIMTMVPLFILMGAFVAESGLGKDAYDAFGKWLARLRGSLAIVSTFACAAFGAVTGSSAANIVTIGGIGIPEMKRYGYSKTLRTGTVASASILANLIPPSMSCIVYSVLTRVSIGQLFMAIIIPGLILTTMYVGTIYVWARIRPGAAPPIEIQYSWGERLKALRYPIPIAVIFLVMIMGIYEGWFSPTEAGGIGAATVLIVVLAMRRMNRSVFTRGMSNALRMTGMIMIIVIGAFTIMYTMTMTRIADVMGDVVIGWGLGPVFIVIFVAVLFVVGGFALQSLPLVVLFLPLFYPLVTEAGWDPVWFGVFIVILMEISLVTPPMATNIYITDLLDDEASTADIIKGVIPFYIAAVVLLGLMIAFPALATWLPSTMH
jgi:C4-dicarboxylate transporter DctM subunit